MIVGTLPRQAVGTIDGQFERYVSNVYKLMVIELVQVTDKWLLLSFFAGGQSLA